MSTGAAPYVVVAGKEEKAVAGAQQDIPEKIEGAREGLAVLCPLYTRKKLGNARG